jgi:hypothetical protein
MKKYDKSTPGEWRARKDRGNSKNGPCSYAVVDKSNHTVALWGNRANMQLLAQAKALRREPAKSVMLILYRTFSRNNTLKTWNVTFEEMTEDMLCRTGICYSQCQVIAETFGPDWKPDDITLEVLRELAEEE